MKVMKFGGTSVGSGSRMLYVAKLIQRYSQQESIVVVISAMAEVTDKLISIFQKYKLQEIADARDELSSLYLSHLEALKDLDLTKGKKDAAEKIIDDLFGQLITRLTLTKEFLASDYDYVISFGERLSVVLVNAALEKTEVRSTIIDSKALIVTNSEFGNSRALFPQTRKKVENSLYPLIFRGIVPVIPGFYGATEDGRVTTLGRGGSDYTATVLAYALDAQEVILWKEVDGIFTGDPEKENNVGFIPELSYRQAIRMAQNGAKILHPEAIIPVAEKDIVVRVKNTFNPDFIGSKIWRGIERA